MLDLGKLLVNCFQLRQFSISNMNQILKLQDIEHIQRIKGCLNAWKFSMETSICGFQQLGFIPLRCIPILWTKTILINIVICSAFVSIFSYDLWIILRKQLLLQCRSQNLEHYFFYFLKSAMSDVQACVCCCVREKPRVRVS